MWKLFHDLLLVLVVKGGFGWISKFSTCVFARDAPDQISYNATLAALSKGGLWQQALEILQHSSKLSL